MDDKTKARLAEWIEKHWRHGPCPVCQAEDWGSGPDIAALSDLVPGATGTVYPVLPFHCRVCGYTLLVNASIAELVVEDEEDEEDGNAEGEGRQS